MRSTRALGGSALNAARPVFDQGGELAVPQLIDIRPICERTGQGYAADAALVLIEQ
jgi:hypothetical protein